MTLSLYRFAGSLDLEREVIWERMLGDSKPYWHAIAGLEIRPGQFRGPALFFDENVCRHARGVAQAAVPPSLLRERPWDSILPLLGFATRYGRGEVTVLSAEQLCCLDEAELEGIFSAGVLLDARAAESLVLMGKGELAGLAGLSGRAGAVVEAVEDGDFGHCGEAMTIHYEGVPWQFELTDRTRCISELRDYEGRRTGHGVVLCENRLGGRTALYPYDSQGSAAVFGRQVRAMLSPSFLSWARQQQLLAVLEWLLRGPVPLFVPGAPSVFPLLVEQDGRLVVAVMSLLPDPVESLTLRLAAPAFPIAEVHALQEDGGWKVLDVPARTQNGICTVETGLRLGYLEATVLTLA